MSYAVISLQVEEADTFEIKWYPSLNSFYNYYGDDVAEGIAIAMASHLLQNNRCVKFLITHFEEFSADTKPDAVKCAAAAAAWIALGYSEKCILFRYKWIWHVSFEI